MRKWDRLGIEDDALYHHMSARPRQPSRLRSITRDRSCAGEPPPAAAAAAVAREGNETRRAPQALRRSGGLPPRTASRCPPRARAAARSMRAPETHAPAGACRAPLARRDHRRCEPAGSRTSSRPHVSSHVSSGSMARGQRAAWPEGSMARLVDLVASWPARTLGVMRGCGARRRAVRGGAPAATA